jgi:hypothetical protein
VEEEEDLIGKKSPTVESKFSFQTPNIKPKIISGFKSPLKSNAPVK